MFCSVGVRRGFLTRPVGLSIEHRSIGCVWRWVQPCLLGAALWVGESGRVRLSHVLRMNLVVCDGLLWGLSRRRTVLRRLTWTRVRVWGEASFRDGLRGGRSRGRVTRVRLDGYGVVGVSGQGLWRSEAGVGEDVLVWVVQNVRRRRWTRWDVTRRFLQVLVGPEQSSVDDP